MSQDPLLHGDDEGVTARVLIDAVLARQVDRDRACVVELRDDGSVVVEVEIRSPGAFRSWLFGMRDHAVVLSPPEVVEDVVSWLRALTRAT